MHILIFTFHNERFAIDATAVKEIIHLPELSPVEEMPDYIAGVFNLRGHIVPVMDLNIRLGHPKERYSTNDMVIITEVRGSEPGVQSEENPPLAKGGAAGGFIFGIIVNNVHDVVAVSEGEIETIEMSDVRHQPSAHLIAGEVKVGEEIIMLLDHKAILDFGLRIADLESKIQIPKSKIEDFTPKELSVFHSRALALMQEPESLTLAGVIPLAVVGLDGEYYGINLETVREFSDVLSVTPVPCTPPHIAGDMNLRGDILTIVDIRGKLNLPIPDFGLRSADSVSKIQSASGGPKSKIKGKVVVARINDLSAGVAVDEVLEVVNINPSDIRPVPSAVKAAGSEFITGETPYRGKMLSILDLKKVLTREDLAVEEEA